MLVPPLTPWARPPALIVATGWLADAQLTEPVRSAVEASVKVPVAVNCWFAPAAIEGASGVTARLASVGAVVLSRIVTRPLALESTPLAGPERSSLNVSVGSTVGAVDELHAYDLGRLAGGEDELAGGDDVVGRAGCCRRRQSRWRSCS